MRYRMRLVRFVVAAVMAASLIALPVMAFAAARGAQVPRTVAAEADEQFVPGPNAPVRWDDNVTERLLVVLVASGAFFLAAAASELFVLTRPITRAEG